MKRLLPAVATAALIVFGGCTSATVRQSQGAATRGLRIASVSVTPDPTTMKGDDLQWMRENLVEGRLSAAIRERLTMTGKLDAAGATLAVKVVSLRLRSTSAAVWLGVMAGSDHITASVEVSDHGKSVKSFVADASRTSGAMANPGAGGRVDSMCDELAERLVEQL
jgi:hypothetical protein